MSTDPEHDIQQLSRDAVTAIQRLETRMAKILHDVSLCVDQLQRSRQDIQRDREELDILFSLERGESQLISAPGTEDLRSREHSFTEQIIEAETLIRGLTDFGSVLSIVARQLGSGRDLPDIDATTHLAVQMASLRAREDERRRFARDIHDGPAQAFANAIIGLEFIDRAIRTDGDDVQDNAIAEIDRVKASMREGLTEIRRFIFDNRPTMLKDRGLVATIEHYVDQYQSIFPMTVTVELEPELPDLTLDQQLTAFRVIQESIQNVSKHSRASLVNVRIICDGGETLIEVTDNGRGFTPDRVRTHAMGGTGLKSMEERAELAGGSLFVDSEPGEGTVVSLRLPSLQTNENSDSR